MRRPQLEMLRGGGEEAPCDLCARGLFLGQGGDDEVTKAQMREFMQSRLPGEGELIAGSPTGHVRVCRPHREDLEGLGDFTFRANLQEAKPARKQRRATAAVVRRAHRASLPRPAPKREPQRGGGGGGVAF